MEIPDLVKRKVGDEDIESAVNLGDENLVYFTPSRTLIYRSEGLISDESIEIYDNDVERLEVSDGRRKTRFSLTYMDGTDEFSVASDRTDPVLQRLLSGILGTAGVIDPDEEVAGVFRFSELTVIVTEKRLVKHVGEFCWDEDFEEYPYADVAGLEFEEGSVATQIVLTIDGRQQRIKAPNDEAPFIRETLTETLCAFHGVNSLQEFNAAVAEEQSATTSQQTGSDGAASDIQLDDSISPLVGGSDDSTDSLDEPKLDTSSAPSEPATQEQTPAASNQSAAAEPPAGNASQPSGIDPEEFETLKERVATLTTAVQRQNELLKQQHETIQQLVSNYQNR